MRMSRRIAIEILIGAALIIGFFYWLYLKPEGGPGVMDVNDPVIKRSVTGNRDKALVIGVDGMDWEVAIPLINQGRMPNLARMVGRGTHGNFTAPPPLISPAIWTTVATGVPREVHGIDNFLAKIPFEYREVMMTSRFRRAPALWQMASWAGRSVGVVNWYSAYPAEELRLGVFVAEGVTPGKVADGHVYPADWRERIMSVPMPRYLDYEKELENVRDSRVDRVYELDRMVFSISLEIMREVHPDLMMVFFQGIDVISHGFWKYSWPVGLDYYYPVSREERKRYRNVVEMHYEFTDRVIGGLLSEAEGYTVIVLSDHGLGPTFPPYNIFPDLNKLLERMGYLTYRGVTCDEVLGRFADYGELEPPEYRSTNIFHLCQELEIETQKWLSRGEESMAPPAVEAFIAARWKFKPPPGEEAGEKRQRAMIKLSQALLPDRQRQEILWRDLAGGGRGGTRVWNVKDFHKNVQGLYINLEDREPEGAVPSREYESFRRKVVKALKGLRTEEGRRLFKKVRANPQKDAMPLADADPPDILVEIDREAMLDNYAYRSPADPDPVPLAAIRWTYHDVSADHVPEGVFAVSGENAKTFKRMDVTDLDVTPTILWLLGIPIGEDMPGKVLIGAFEERLQTRKPLYIESWSKALDSGVISEPVDLSPEKLKQLKDLGYIQ
jgi:predicted AlkP superfamily phosphohydrolase/phosphomutase